LLLTILSVWVYFLKKDIKHRKTAEKQLLDNDSYLREIQKIALIGHWEIKVKGSVYWSNDLFQLFGFPTTSPPGLELFSTIVSKADFLAYKASIEQSLLTGKDHSYQCEIRF
jgi:hypothetical protein